MVTIEEIVQLKKMRELVNVDIEQESIQDREQPVKTPGLECFEK